MGHAWTAMKVTTTESQVSLMKAEIMNGTMMVWKTKNNSTSCAHGNGKGFSCKPAGTLSGSIQTTIETTNQTIQYPVWRARVFDVMNQRNACDSAEAGKEFPWRDQELNPVRETSHQGARLLCTNKLSMRCKYC
jgi:hypothetical protein